MVGGDSQYVFNVYSDNPQLAAGHEPTAPNFEQQIAVYGIYTGDGAGARDAAISILWLKAFGTTSISVPGPDTKEYYHPFRNAAKFDGVLPVLWHEDGDTIYGVPMRSRSLAHVIPPEAAVQRPPVNSIDIEELEAYVSALDNPALPLAEIQWGSPSHGTIRSRMSRSQAVSVQVSWNPAWRASSGGHRVPVRKDGLGLILIEPACDGDCTIDLSYGATFETWLCRALSALAVVALAVTSIPMRVNNRPST
jgi:hypothetical protein